LCHKSCPAIFIHRKAALKECNESIPSTVRASHSSEFARVRKPNVYK
jgi:hypothetical protein